MPLSPFPIRNQIGRNQAVVPHTGFSPVRANPLSRSRPFADGGSPTTIPGIKFKNLNIDDVASVLSPQVLSSLQKNRSSGFTPPQPASSNVPLPQRKPQDTKDNAPNFGGYASGGTPVASSSVAPLTSDGASAYPTLPAAQGLTQIPSTSQPYSSSISTVPMSTLVGGAGSNGVIAPVNNMGIPQGSPGTPTTVSQSSLSPSIPPSMAPVTETSPITPSNNQMIDGIGTPISTLESQGLTFSQATALSDFGFSHGGSTHLADGGFPTSSEASPWYARAEARGADSPIHTGGILPGNTGGRTDVLNKIVPAGSYVLPADVVSGLGEGNTNSGSHVLDIMMHTLPYGIQGGGHKGGGTGIPRAPSSFKQPSFNLNQVKKGGPINKYASGGPSEDASDDWNNQQKQHEKQLIDEGRGHGEILQWDINRYNDGDPVESSKGGAPHGEGPVPVVLASGEYLVPREKVMALGNGNLKSGHKILDHFVLHVRNKTAKTLQKLPGPKK